MRKVIGKREGGIQPTGGGSIKHEKNWRDALRVALMRTDKGEDPRPRLYRIAETVVLMAIDGDMQAIKEIGDRIDGRPAQQIDVQPSDLMREIVVTWAKAQPTIIDAEQQQNGDSISDDTVRAPTALPAPTRPG